MTDPNTIDPEEVRTAGDQSSDVRDSETGPDKSADELAKLQRERDDLHDRLLRKSAEFDNYRKRVEKERREQSEWAAADVLSDVLAVLDDFDRALAVEAPPEARGYRTGLELIHRQLGELLRKRGVTALDTLGTEFDPHLHQAVAYEETPGAREGEVVGEMRRGYRLG
jgi:molecular chaperone GrpE